MKYIKHNVIVAAALLASCIVHTEPSAPRKVAASITSPVAALGVLSLAGFATDALVKNLFGVTHSIRPWLIGAATAYVGYKTFLPTTHIFYTLLADNAQKLIALVGKEEGDKGIIQKNEATIKEILREILYVKNELVNDFKQIHQDSARRDAVLTILNKGIFSLNGIVGIIGDTNIPLSRPSATCVADVLKNTKNLVAKKDNNNSHWWSTSIGKTLLWTRNVVIAPFTYIKDSHDQLTLNIKEDSRLLARLGGKAIEEAAKDLCEVVKTAYVNNALYSSDVAEKLFSEFYIHAEKLTRFAENVLKDLKAQREEIQRIRDVVFLFKKPSDEQVHFEGINDYSMNILSQIYA